MLGFARSIANFTMNCAIIIKSNKQSNVQFSINQNFALSCATLFDLTNKRAIGHKAFQRCVELHVIQKHESALHDGSKFEKQ